MRMHGTQHNLKVRKNENDYMEKNIIYLLQVGFYKLE